MAFGFPNITGTLWSFRKIYQNKLNNLTISHMYCIYPWINKENIYTPEMFLCSSFFEICLVALCKHFAF